MRQTALCIAFCLALAFVIPAQTTQAAPESEKELNLLWDIPFGISEEQFNAEMKEKTLIDMTDFSSHYNFDLDPAKKIAGYTYEAILSNFDGVKASKNGQEEESSLDTEGLSLIMVVWNIDDFTTSQYTADQYAAILFSLSEKYGDPDTILFKVRDHYCTISIDGYIKTEDIILAQENKDGPAIVEAMFNNISLVFTAQYNDKEQYERSITLIAFQDPGPIEIPPPESLASYSDIADSRRVNGVGF